MIAAVNQRRFQADDRISGQNALLDAVLQSLFNCREEVARNSTAEDILSKYQSFAVARLKLNPDVAVLAMTTRLFLMLALNLNRLADGFTVSDGRSLQQNVNTELGFQFGKGDIQMLFAQAGKDLLAGLRIGCIGQSGIFFEDTGNRGRDLGLVALAFCLDCHRVAGLGEVGTCKRDRTRRIAEGIAGIGGQFGDCADIACGNFLDLLLLLAADKQQLAGTLGYTSSGIEQLGISSNLAGQNLDIGQLADKRVGNRCEDIGTGGLFDIALDLDHLILGLAFLAGNLGRRREHRNHRAQQKGQALLFLCAAAEYRGDGTVEDTLVQALYQLQHREFLTGEVFFHQVVVNLGDSLRNCADQAFQTMAHVGQLDFLTGAIFISIGFHADQVDVAFDLVVLDIRDNDRADLRAELVFQFFQHFIVIGMGGIHLADKDCAGFFECFCFTERLLRTDSQAGFTGHDDQHSTGSADRFGLAECEVEQTRCVKQVDLGIRILDRNDRKVERRGALDLLGIIVGDGVALGNFAQTVDSPGTVGKCLNQRGFARTAVTDDRNVADIGCIILFHKKSILSIWRENGVPFSRTGYANYLKR